MYTLLIENLKSKTKTYFQKLYEKRTLWAFAFNKEDSLNSHCTGLVENINKQLKMHIGIKSSLAEYFYRVIKFTSQVNNHDVHSAEDLKNFNNNYALVKSTSFVQLAKEYISEFALIKLVLNTIKTLSWKFNPEDPLELINVSNPEFKYTLDKKEEKWNCSCGFFKAMLMPCEHILKILTHEGIETEILDYFDVRWLKSLHIEVDDMVLKELERMISQENDHQEGLIGEERESDKL